MPKKDINDKMPISFATDRGESLIPDDDEEFEREAARRYREGIENEEERIRDAEKRLEQEKRNYQEKLRQEKIAMLKAKQGIEDDDTANDDPEDEQEEEPVKMPLGKRIENFWYHYKWITIISIVVVAFLGYELYSFITRVSPDIMIIVTADNGLSYRSEEVQRFFEKYCDDLNGDGKVSVEVIFAPMNPGGGTDNYTQSNETKLYSNLSNAQCVLYLTDADSIFSLEQVAFDDLSGKFDSKYVSGDKLSLDGKLIRDGFNWAQMPDDMVLMIRTPVKTLYSSVDDMQKTHDDAMTFIENLIEAMEEYDNYYGEK